MRLYKFTDIKEKANCREVAAWLGLTVDNSGRCAATWRGGNNNTAVSMDDKHWKDFAADTADNEGGSVIDLVRVVMFGNMEKIQGEQMAQEWLGDKLNLDFFEPEKSLPGTTRYDHLIEEGYKEVARYEYTDEVGNVAHYSVRLEHPAKGKTFIQGANGNWGTKGVKLYPYNLTTVLSSNWVYICEGEKSAHALIDRGQPATTNVAGSGKWTPEYSEYFKGKSVAILTDNDAPGTKHGKQVAKSLLDIATEIRIIKTSEQDGGDVFDWFAESPATNTTQALLGMVQASPIIKAADLEDVEAPIADTEAVQAAKDANKYPIKNFLDVKVVDDKGITKIKQEPKQINKLVGEIKRRFIGFPYRVGGALFDHDRDSHEIYVIRNNSMLFSWMARKSNQIIDWPKQSNLTSKAEMFEALHAEAARFESISKVPDWPHRNDVYYAHKATPEPDPNHKYFNEFMDFFCPMTKAFKTILKAFIVAPIFYRKGVSRPLWIIGSEVAGSGKTTLATIVSQLYGGPVIGVEAANFRKDMEKVTKRILSPEGRTSRMLLVDNVSGVFSSDELSSLITAPYITGMAAYGRGEESRPNNLTYVITANGATIDNDIAIRAFFVDLAKINYSATWNKDLQNYIEKYQLNIFADILSILNNHNPERFDVVPCTRFPEFEVEVLQAVCEDLDEYNAVIESIVQSRTTANVEEDYGREIEDVIAAELRELGINPESSSVWIRSGVVKEWAQKAFPESKKNAMQFIRNLSRAGHAPRIHTKWTAFPSSGKERRRGILWLNESESTVVQHVVKKHGRIFAKTDTGHTSECPDF